MIRSYSFDVVFKHESGVTSYAIQVKDAEGYTDALIKLVRLASLHGEIQKIEKID